MISVIGLLAAAPRQARSPTIATLPPWHKKAASFRSSNAS